MSKVVFCGTCNTFASFSQDELQFSWQAQHFRDLCRHFAWQAQHSTLLHPVHFTLQALHSTLSPLHSTLYTLHSTLYTPHFTLHTFHSTLYTPDFALHTLHFTLHTLHSTLHTPDSILYTLRSTLYTPYFTLQTTLYTPHLAMPPSSIFHSLRRTGMVAGEKCIVAQDCSNKLFHKSVLRDCISMCFDVCTMNISVSIRVRGLHLVSAIR